MKIKNIFYLFVSQIKKTEQPTGFKGLGKLKKTIIKNGVEMLSDEKGFLAIPGVSGGNSTKMEDDETEFVMEIANFKGDRVAASAFTQKYRSTGARVWISGVNSPRILICLLHLIESLEENLDSFVHAININIDPLLSWVNGEDLDLKIASNHIINKNKEENIEVDFQYISDRLDNQGLEYWKPIIEDNLTNIGSYKDGIFSPNIFYSNIHNREDIYAELVRIIGFDMLKPQKINSSITTTQEKEFNSNKLLKKLVCSYGFDEITNRPFVEKEQTIGYMNNGQDETGNVLQVLKPQNSQEDRLRDSLLPTLLKTLEYNIKRGEKEIKIFKINKIYTWEKNQINEQVYLSGLSVTKDPYIATSIVNEVLLKMPNDKIATSKGLPAKYENIGLGYTYKTDQITACVIQVSNKLKKIFNIPLNKDIWFFEIDITNWNNSLKVYNKYQNESTYPTISRSYSMYVPTDFQWKDIENINNSYQKNDVSITLSPIERMVSDGKNVLNFDVEFVSYNRTLQKEDVAKWEVNLLKSLPEINLR